MKLQIKYPRWCQPLNKPATYKGAYGGRGGGKSHYFAEQAILKSVNEKCRILCAREIQNSIKDSVKHLLEKKIDKLGLSSIFHITRDEIVCTLTGSRFIFRGLRDQNADTLKSVDDVKYCWVEEAQTISQHSLDILIPTIREDDSELWFSWNPRHKTDAIEQLLRFDAPSDSNVVEVQYTDNPFIPQVLLDKAEECRVKDPAKYMHVWGGGYSTITEGSYYAKEMGAVLNEGRLHEWDLEDCNDTNGVVTWWDLGRNDYTSIWFGKFVGDEIHIIDFYENRFEFVEHYIDYVNRKPYTYDHHYLPHDAKNKTISARKSAHEYVKLANMPVTVIPRTKSVLDDIDAVRRILPLCHFYKPNCERGTDHLMEYRRKQNATTGIFEENHVHDEASHAADAFRYLAVTHPLNKRDRTVQLSKVGGL